MSLDHDTVTRRRPMRGLFGRFFARRDGATAIEFAILAIPFFVIVFASIETFVAFTAEQLLANATETMARKIRTGEIKSDTMTAEQYRAAFCEEIKILMPCSADELKKPTKLFLDVQKIDKFSLVPATVTLNSADLTPDGLKFSPGGKKTINVVRAFYRWDVFTDLVRPLIYNVSSSDGSQRSYLMIATAVVLNENYPD
jgi:Flp pilus assembly protein TadG